MLGKLLKYEFKANGRILLPIYGALIITGIVSGVSVRIANLGYIDGMLDTESAISGPAALLWLSPIIVFVALIFAALALSVVFSILRFKKNLLGSEGYLMNTLPVTPFANVSAKLISAIIMQISAFIVMIISLFFFIMIGMGEWSDYSRLFTELFKDFDVLDVSSAVITLIYALSGTILFNTTVYAAMSCGHFFNKRKVLASIGVYMAFNFGVSMLNQVLSSFILRSLAIIIDYNAPAETVERLVYIMNQRYIFSGILNIVFSVLFIWLTTYMIKNKLNLE